MPMQPTHLAFSDESNHNRGRFRSLAVVTLSVDQHDDMDAALRRLLKDSGITEFKWTKLRTARERLAAEKLLLHLVDSAHRRRIRADVLIWDTEDSRHHIQGRDDIENLHRMHHHLLRSVLRHRWPDEAIWTIHPDEQSAIQWERVRYYLERKALVVETIPEPFSIDEYAQRVVQQYEVVAIDEKKSHDCPFIQLADLLAGLAIYSRDSFESYEEHLLISQSEGSFLPYESTKKMSNADKERCNVLEAFNRACKSKKLGVGLQESRGLKTYDPKNHINFWWYEPQRDEDKAPTRT